MLCLRILAISAALSSFVFHVAPPARADRQCDVPAGYYRLVDSEDDGAIEFREAPDRRSQLLSALEVGQIVQSDGMRSPDNGTAATTWQQVTIHQTVGWVPARKMWRALPLTLQKSVVPTSGRCGDSSPLWSMIWKADKMRLSFFPVRYDLPIHSVTVSSNATGALVSGSAPGIAYRLIYSDEVCRNRKGEMIGLGKASLIVDREGIVELYTGCCTANPEAFVQRTVTRGYSAEPDP